MVLLPFCLLTFAQTAVIKTIPVSHQEIADGVIDTMKFKEASNGLTTVGVGDIIYFTGYDAGGDPVTNYKWGVTGPSGSMATLDDADPMFVAFKTDTTGAFVISLEITTANGTHDTTLNLTSAKYVGVGIIGGASPDFSKGQCALCHSPTTDEWKMTGHADKLQRELSGLGSSHFRESCIECHSVGYNNAPEADNDGFDDIARNTGWMFPATLEEQSWTDLVTNYPDLAQRANVQCESCHGPGSMHKGSPGTISVSLDAGMCGKCHEDEPYHTKNIQWKNSAHAVGVASAGGRESCAACHSGYGFINSVDEFQYIDQVVGSPQISCAVCHDPHNAENEHQIRTLQDVTLPNGETLTFGGQGKLCMQCHHGRRDAETYVTEYHSHYGPHYSNQADMLAGTNAIEYDKDIVGSNHKGVVADLCVTCHMSEGPASGDPGHNMIGGHSFAMEYEDESGKEIDNVSACKNCHGNVTSFDDFKAKYDYDLDGEMESVQEEIEGLLHNLGMLLPPLNEPTVEVTNEYTAAQLKAAFNYLFVEEDGSMGIHNTNYSVEILSAAIKDLGGSTYVRDESDILPSEYALSQNYPNPFNPTTEIKFSVPEKSDVRLTVYNLLGEEITNLVNGTLEPGNYKTRFNANNLPSGIYLYRLESKAYMETRKMLLLK